MTTWGDLRAGDVVQARTGGFWQVQSWADVAGTRWLAAGGGGRQRVFTLGPVDASRPPITAPHVLSDPVSRVYQYGEPPEVQAAIMALIAGGFQLTIMEESVMPDPIPPPTPPVCQHPQHAVSRFKTGALVCTECFTTLEQPAAPAAIPVDPAAVAAPPGALGDIVPPYDAIDSSGVHYSIPARERMAACAANIHPVVSVQWEGDRLRGCGACGLVFPNYLLDALADPAPVGLPDVTAGYQAAAAALIESTLEALDEGAHLGPDGLVIMGTDEQRVAAEPVTVPNVPYDAPNWPGGTTQPPTTVTVVTEPDVFADPAPTVHAVKRDRWKRYLLPDPETGDERAWTRASTLARALADEYNLTGWKLRMVALGIARNPDLAAGVLALKDPHEGDDKKTMKDLVGKAMERAESTRGANLGTALHNFTHRMDRGEPFAQLGAPPPLDADLIEYQATLKRYGLGVVPDLIERIVICPELGAAGTFDRILTQHPGPFSPTPLTMSDLKTGKTADDWHWLEWAIQLSIYANATHLWDPVTRTYTPMPPRNMLDRDRALIIHLPVGKGKGVVYGLNLIEGWEAAKLAERVRSIRNSGKGYGWSIEPVDAESLLIYRVSQADGREIARLWDRHFPRGEWTPAVEQAAAERVARLQDVPL